jgi:DNA helicase HerA-like ATPase
MPDEDTDLLQHMARYRHVRELIERSILPLATSVDGAAFTVQASLYDLALRRGGYVVLESDGRSLLGQVTDLTTVLEETTGETPAGGSYNVYIRLARGRGMVLDSDGLPFHDAVARPARPEEVGAWLDRVRGPRAGLAVGELLHAPGVTATLDSGGFNRHTFMCGQSGSGKTYSLGLLLERILAETSLRVVILDPNSDYVGLGRVREDADPAAAERYRGVPQDLAVWSNDPDADHLLRLRFAELDPAVQAACLGLDPVRDREEYAVLTELIRGSESGKPLVADLDELMDAGSAGARALGLRAGNLGVTEWRLWSPVLPSLVEELRSPTRRCTVVDLGSLDTVVEQRLVAETVLGTLWEARRSREPCLVVIDEAHNICPADPADPVTGLATERAVQIAAEGRKYGLYLLTSTQRPHKVHPNVVSQCDNLLLMRMNSEADLQDLTALFSFVPPGLVAGATAFRMGQALVAGKIIPQPAYVQMGARVSQEGGADIPTRWAEPRPAVPLIPDEG